MLIIGLDPGTETGLATWHLQEQALGVVASMPIHRAMGAVQAAHRDTGVLVLFEDARLRRWFSKMDAKQAKYGAAIREGAGAAKRDATIWEDFLTDERIPFVPRAPQATKRKAPIFQQITGWKGKTNEHSRDAALIVHGMSQLMFAALLQTAQRRFPKTEETKKL